MALHTENTPSANTGKATGPDLGGLEMGSGLAAAAVTSSLMASISNATEAATFAGVQIESLKGSTAITGAIAASRV